VFVLKFSIKRVSRQTNARGVFPNTLLIAVTKQHPDNDENQNGAETSAAEFGSAIACNEASEDIVHSIVLRK
jgi:hypothetical protein